MLSAGAISSSAISALPDYLLGTFSATFLGVVTYQAAPFSTYRQLVSSQARVVYTMELDYRVVR